MRTAVITFFIGLLLGWLLFEQTDNKTQTTHNNIKLQCNQSDSIAMKKRIEQLTLDNKLLQKNLELISRNAIIEKRTNHSISLPEEHQAQQLKPHDISEVANNIKNAIGVDIISFSTKLKTDFHNEEENYSWSETQEKTLSDLFIEEKKLRGIPLKEIDCKTMQCRIKIFSGNNTQNNKAIKNIIRSIDKSQHNYNYFIDPLEKGTEKTIYLKFNHQSQ